MAELIVLVDPDDINSLDLINQINKIKPKNVWVGYTNSPGEAVVKIFKKLKVSASLFPGSFEQVREGYYFAEHIYVPSPIYYKNPVIKEIKLNILNFLKNRRIPKNKWEFMDYALLHPNCNAAGILGVDRVLSDKDILNSIKKPNRLFYLEGGSRNKSCPINDRLELAKEIQRRFPKLKLICAGGISNTKQVKQLSKNCSYVLVSHALHCNPEHLKEYMNLF